MFFTSLSTDLFCVSSTPSEPIVLVLCLVTFLLLLSYSCSDFYYFSLFPAMLSSFFPFSSLHYSPPDFLSSHISTRLRTERFGGSNPGWDKRLLFFPQRLARLCGPPSILFSWYRDCFPEADRPCVKLINHIHQLLSLRMSGAIPLLPTLCFHGGDRGKLCLFYYYSPCPSPYSPFRLPSRPLDPSCVLSRKCALSN